MRMLCFIAVMLGLPAFAEVYKVVDADGNITYTDQPQPDAQLAPLALPPVNKIPAAQPAPPGEDNESETREAQPEPFAGYTQAYILSPEQDQIIPNQQSNIIVQLWLQPQLQSGHRVQLFLNGQPQGAPVDAATYQLEDLERGSYQISAQIQSAQGKTLVSLQPVSIHVQRHFKHR